MSFVRFRLTGRITGKYLESMANIIEKVCEKCAKDVPNRSFLASDLEIKGFPAIVW